MKLYTAAVFSNSYKRGQNRYVKLNEVERQIADSLPNILESYHYVGEDRAVQSMRDNKAEIFLDSGAFSAYTLGTSINIDKYCAYIKSNWDILRNEDGIVMASVLDGIGDPLQTYKNQSYMEAQGVTPLPCFHANEDYRYLEHYVANYSYITLGGMVGASVKDLIRWLDQVWEKYLIDGAGRARLKVHGFGLTSIPIMSRYPWHSVDSSSWIQSAAFGSVVTPEWGPISVSSKSPSRHDEGQHISTFSGIEREQIRQSLGAQGFEIERLATVYESRAVYNLWAYNEINRRVLDAKPNAFVNEQPTLFS